MATDCSTKVQRAERILLAIGLTLTAVWVAARLDSVLGSRAALARFEAAHAINTAASGRTRLQSVTNSSVDFASWSRSRILEYEDSLTEVAGTPEAILRIPKIRLEVPVFEGTSDLALNRGVGRIPGTAPIGRPGNLALAGHRDGFFRGLQSIALGDIVDLVRAGQTDRYTVSQIRIVAPDDTSVLNPTDRSRLTLVTCFPFHFVGHAPKRFIVIAALVGADQSAWIPNRGAVLTDSNTKNKEKKR
jgi:sortase A